MNTEKSQSKTIYIDHSQRLWAMPRHLQRFWGHFELNEEIGLYFAKGSPLEKIALVVANFKKLPGPFTTLCRQWRLTLSFADGAYTACGNASTFYADFGKEKPEAISPHVEIGEQSLKADLILPHLAHEVAHLFWRTRIEAQRRAYRSFLERTCPRGSVEITTYVHEFFSEYLKSLKAFKKGEVHPNLHDGNFRIWTEESFCDSIGTHLAGYHPNYTKGCTVDLNLRVQAMAEHLDLVV